MDKYSKTKQNSFLSEIRTMTLQYTGLPCIQEATRCPSICSKYPIVFVDGRWLFLVLVLGLF